MQSTFFGYDYPLRAQPKKYYVRSRRVMVRVRVPISPPYDYAALIARRPVRVRIRPFSSAVTICKTSTLIVKLYPFCALQRNVSK